jgi:hypothetical protein
MPYYASEFSHFRVLALPKENTPEVNIEIPT